MKPALKENQTYVFTAKDTSENYTLKIISVQKEKVIIIAEDRLFTVKRPDLEQHLIKKNLRLI